MVAGTLVGSLPGISASVLGAKHVYAVDIDPQAVTATNQNIKRNQLQANTFTIGDINILENINADVLVANILKGPLMTLKDTLAKHIKSNGLLLVSGILNSQVDSLIQHYSTEFIHLDTNCREDWSSILFKARQ